MMLNNILYKVIILVIYFVFSQNMCFSQSYNQEQTALKNFLVRMYKSAPFEGVKVVSDYENNYLLSVVTLKKSANTPESTTNRIAQVKSSRQVSQYINGITFIDSQTIIYTNPKQKEENPIEEMTDMIKENSIGFTKAMEVLTVISDEQKLCYMFIKKIDKNK
ncbi:hypothetical protein [Phocaeicola plebeius]|uniref:hypothetical protein n=1 Tax=Phocaeicola plebeius TaxID=310297 RepID=UPI00307DB12E